jgi:hypothetical protein
MTRENLISIIVFVILIFAIGKIAMQQLCQPVPNNPVVNAVSSAFSSPEPKPAIPQPDPLSWDLTLHRIVTFLSKACTR